MPHYFISDLHLSVDTPQAYAHFLAFLAARVSGESVYILGDLFDVWLGDDLLGHDAFADACCAALAATSDRGVQLYALCGNRDFLLGEAFARASRLTLLPDPFVLTQGNHTLLLTHGDALCTDDVTYQAFRAEVRTTAWQTAFLQQPLAARQALAQTYRQESEYAKQHKSAQIMDVNPDALTRLFEAHYQADTAYPVMIQGHTHRPATHTHTLSRGTATRLVLPDWHGLQGGYVSGTAQTGWMLHQFG